ncbi:LOW QUALITY PROTEIN: pentatricopeptide repeat protein [Purpureocillium lavendulum]|uniref:Pentatricopeptide repeat protein n=1 Tax=Purpureocillium lavendulum TaxID=1247861 RepID=A0AB34G049_9HYPO|nr:LOW QUALITY PROTEIN: pentatricopeptide repeat protein [Purpureocillium lavendulum]
MLRKSMELRLLRNGSTRKAWTTSSRIRQIPSHSTPVGHAVVRRRRSLTSAFQTVKTRCSRDKLRESDDSGTIKPARSSGASKESSLKSGNVPPVATSPPRLDVLSELPSDGLQRSSTFRASLEKAVEDINIKYGTTRLPENGAEDTSNAEAVAATRPPAFHARTNFQPRYRLPQVVTVPVARTQPTVGELNGSPCPSNLTSNVAGSPLSDFRIDEILGHALDEDTVPSLSDDIGSVVHRFFASSRRGLGSTDSSGYDDPILAREENWSEAVLCNIGCLIILDGRFALAGRGEVRLELLTVGVEGLDLAIDLGADGPQLAQVLFGEHLLVDDLVEGAEHEAGERDDLALVVVQGALVLLVGGAGLVFEVVVVDLFVRLPEAGEGRGDLDSVSVLGGGHGVVSSLLGLGAEVEVADEGDAQEEAQGVDVGDGAETGRHGVEDGVGILDGVGVDVVADARLHGDAEGLGAEVLVGHDVEDGGGVGAGLCDLEHAEHAQPVVAVRDDAVVADHEVPVLDADGGELGGGERREDEGERVAPGDGVDGLGGCGQVFGRARHGNVAHVRVLEGVLGGGERLGEVGDAHGLLQQVEHLALIVAAGGHKQDAAHGADELLVDDEAALPPLVHDLGPEGLGAVDGALDVGGVLLPRQVLLEASEGVVSQGVEDGGVRVGGGGARRLVDRVGDEEHGVEVAGAGADVEHGVEVDRVGLQARVRHEQVVVLDGLGDGELGVLGAGAAAEQDELDGLLELLLPQEDIRWFHATTTCLSLLACWVSSSASSKRSLASVCSTCWAMRHGSSICVRCFLTARCSRARSFFSTAVASSGSTRRLCGASTGGVEEEEEGDDDADGDEEEVAATDGVPYCRLRPAGRSGSSAVGRRMGASREAVWSVRRRHAAQDKKLPDMAARSSAMAPNAPDFQKFITDARERKKNEALADKIFSRDRRQSAPSKLKATPGGSLASRVGVIKKRAADGSSRRSSMPSAGDVNGEWTHDLHDSVNARPGSLASRISQPGAAPSKKAPAVQQRKSKLSSALDRTDVNQLNVVNNGSATAGGGMGISIRGLAGPFAVMGQNFAPGTTAADIESAMTPIGGDMVSCTIVKTRPFVLADMVFSSREGGQRVIDTFNDKTADGRILKVYAKPGTYASSASANTTAAPANAPNGPRATRAATSRDQVVDGRLGFSDDLMDTDRAASSKASTRQPLYSDKLIAGNRRGRGRGGR